VESLSSIKGFDSGTRLTSKGVQHANAYVGMGVIFLLLAHMLWMAGQNRLSYEASQARLQQIQDQAALEEKTKQYRPLNVDIIKVTDYWYRKTPNTPPRLNVAALKLTTPIAKVVDAEGECVGTIERGQLLFRKNWRGVCEDKAIQKRLDKEVEM
jgi:hypothetical protein